VPEQNNEDPGKKPMDDSFVGNEEVAATQQPVIPPAPPPPNSKPPRKGPLVAALILLALFGAGGYYFYNLRFRPEKVQEITIDMPKQPAEAAPTPPAPVEPVVPPPPIVPEQKKTVVRPAKRPAAKKTEPAQPAPRAKEEPVPPPKVEAPPPPKPEQPPVPSSGVMLWSGRVEKNGTIVIDGGKSETGAVNGAVLPGVPVTVRVEPKGFTVEEPPSAANGWKRIAILSQKKAHIVVTVFWNAKPQ
jgi:hypothetical protein